MRLSREGEGRAMGGEDEERNDGSRRATWVFNRGLHGGFGSGSWTEE